MTKNVKKEEIKLKLENSILEKLKQKLPEKKEKQRKGEVVKEIKNESRKEENLEEEINEIEAKRERIEPVVELGGSGFNPNELILRSGQKLEEVAEVFPTKKPDEKEKTEEKQKEIVGYKPISSVYEDIDRERERRRAMEGTQAIRVQPTLTLRENLNVSPAREFRERLGRADMVHQNDWGGGGEQRIYDVKNESLDDARMPWERDVKREMKYKGKV